LLIKDLKNNLEKRKGKEKMYLLACYSIASFVQRY